MCDGFRILRQPSPAAERALAALLPDPDLILSTGEICKPGSRSHCGVIDVAGRRYFLKRYNDRGLWYRLQYLVRRSRAVYTWRLARKFIARDVPVPVPLLCLEARRYGVLGRSYVLMEEAPGQVLRKLWPGLADDRKLQVLTTLGNVFGRMHRQGCLHGDLKWDNIVLAFEGEQLTVRLVDLDGGRQLFRPSKWLARKDLARFVKDLHRAEVELDWEQRLLLSWQAGWEG